MPDAEKSVLKALKSVMRSRKKRDVDVTLDANLYDDLKLDSLDVAELSVVLEDDLGTDPYSEGAEPKTVAEVIEFYER
jgi:acyl carrier protein